MLHSVCRQDNISNVNLCSERTCNSCIDHSVHMKIIHKDLGADSCVDFSDA